jgi:mRNA interferase MazF
MKRGEVFWADLNPPFGSEPGKTRPVLVVQSDALTGAGHNSIIVLPITSQLKPQPHPYRVHIPKGAAGLTKPADILIDQISARDHRRFHRHAGTLPNAIMAEVDLKLQRVLDLI